MTAERIPAAADGLEREHATLVSIDYQDRNGPWSICAFRREDGSVFKSTGNFGKVILYEDFILYGKWSPNVVGGDFDTSSFNSMPPRALGNLARYLNSLSNVSLASTNLVVQHFGENLIDILDRSPQRLVEAGIREEEAATLGKVWESERSQQLALAQIDLEGIPPQKLATLQRRLGYMTDLNLVLRQDPYLLYVHFDDMSFQTAQSLARRFRVANDTLSAVKGAVIAILRREAWLGHSFIEGKPLMEAVEKLLHLSRQTLAPLIKDAVTQLSTTKVTHTHQKCLQLHHVYEIEKSLVEKAIRWTKLNADDLDDLVPSAAMAAKLLKPLDLPLAASKTLSAGLCSLMAERLGLVQCETLADQLTIARGIDLFLNGFGTDVLYAAPSLEMVAELRATLGEDAPIVVFSELVGLDPVTGVPLQHQRSPIEADVVVFVATDALGVEEMHFLLEAMPSNGRLFMLGVPKDLPSQTIGQPFDEMAKVPEIRAFMASFWLPARSEPRLFANKIWSGAIRPDDTFDPAKPISWINASREDLPEAVCLLMRQLGEACNVDPLLEIKPVVPKQQADVPGGDVTSWLSAAIAQEFVGEASPVEFHGKQLFKGMPVIIRQPLSLAIPAFSLLTPSELTCERMVAKPIGQPAVELGLKDYLTPFHGGVLIPKFIRGRVFEVVILVVLKEHLPSINAELLATLLNSSRRTVVLVGDIDQIGDTFPLREPSRVRSMLPFWTAPHGDSISTT